MILEPSSAKSTTSPISFPFPNENLVPILALLPGFTNACQVSSSVLFSNKNSILPPVSTYSPISLAGITLVLLSTKQSPGFK